MKDHTWELLSCLPLRKKYNLGCLPLHRRPLHKKNRSHFEIIALMLEAVKNNGATRFSVMKHTSISSAQLKKYLGSLTKMGFIETDKKDGRVLYRASERGLAFLRQYYVLLGILLSAEMRETSTSSVHDEENNSSNRQKNSKKRIVTHLRHTP